MKNAESFLKMPVKTFLRDYWQKKPLLIRQAFPNFQDFLTPDELAGLAMEEGGHARLILEKGGKKPWTLKHGPFTEKELSRLPTSHWSLLVSNLEQWLDEAASFLDQFSFIPHWRSDDLMASFAPVHGTVGPHVDSYDVFLIQGLGRRRWSIAERGDNTFLSDCDIKVLKRFKAEQEWILEPGDMLYLPPNVQHYGVALEPCMTYSVGYRAPAWGDMFADLLNLPNPEATAYLDDKLYQYPDLKLQKNPGEISRDAIKKVEDALLAHLDRGDHLAQWFGSFVTRPAKQADGPKPKTLSATALNTKLAKHEFVWRSDEKKVAYLPAQDGDQIHLFIAGETYLVRSTLRPVIELVTAQRQIPTKDLLPKGKSRARDEYLAFIALLFNVGLLTWH